MLLNPRGKYLSVAFSGDTDFMGTGTLRTSPAGINIYFSPLKASESLVAKYLYLLESKHIIVPQKPNLEAQANYIFAEKIK
jgi:glyoxylase-like metal-dependent hydrolase (beta-lactamase superfamily II)